MASGFESEDEDLKLAIALSLQDQTDSEASKEVSNSAISSENEASKAPQATSSNL
jgi:hypothetical protein